MKRKKNKERNYAFIDNENVNLSIQRLGRKIDWGKLRKFLQKDLQVEKAYMFLGYIQEFEPMYELFRDVGYELVFKKVLQGDDIPNKGNIDAELVLHTMIHLQEYEQAVVVSGDGDFASLVEYLMSINKLRAVIAPNKERSSGFLQDAAEGRFLYLDGFKRRLAYRSKTKKKKKGEKEKEKGKEKKQKKEQEQSTTKKKTTTKKKRNSKKTSTSSSPDTGHGEPFWM